MKGRSLVTILALAAVLALAVVPVASAAPPAARSAATFYTVRRGDTLSAIARRFGVTVDALVLANNIANRNRILTGQRLLIPTGIGTACDFRIYTVQRGDTLSSIGRRFGVTVTAIAGSNRLANINRILTGQRLVIPRSGITIQEPAPNAIIQGGSVRVSGTGSAFENMLGVEVRTAAGTVLGRATATITGAEPGQAGPFEVEITFAAPARSQSGRIVVFDVSARDGSVIDQACVDVTLAPAAAS